MQQEKAVFRGRQMKSSSWQQRRRQERKPNFQPGLFLVSPWVCVLTPGKLVSQLTGWSKANQAQTSEQAASSCAQAWDWMHKPMEAWLWSSRVIPQRSPSYPQQGSVWALSILTWEQEQLYHVYCPSPCREGKVGLWEYLLFGFLCWNFDLFW